jgi:hypothetical protein
VHYIQGCMFTLTVNLVQTWDRRALYTGLYGYVDSYDDPKSELG